MLEVISPPLLHTHTHTQNVSFAFLFSHLQVNAIILLAEWNSQNTLDPSILSYVDKAYIQEKKGSGK